MILTPSQLTTCVHEWVDANQAKIYGVMALQGGWEAWAQTEIGASIQARFPGADVLRDQCVYADPQMRVDFVLNQSTRKSGAQVVLAELRCESLSAPEHFRAGLIADLSRLSHGLKGTSRARSQRVSMAICFSAQAEAALAERAAYTQTAIGDLKFAWHVLPSG